LTSAQQRLIDVFFGVFQAARSWSGHFVIFSGTCALWRRSALDQLGGWQSDIFMEDMDLSCRAFLAGWRGPCLVTLAVPGELPSSTGSWQRQQYRWNGGLAQAMRKPLPAISRSRLPLGRKLIASSCLGNAAFGALLAIAAVGLILEFPLGAAPSPWVRAFAAATGVAFAVAVLAMPLSQRQLRGANPWADLPQALLSILVLIYTQVAVALSFRHSLSERGPRWTPTPKTGSPLGAQARETGPGGS